MTDEEKKKGKESPTNDENEGVQSEADKKVEQLNADTERINQAIAENENAKAREKLGGVTEGKQDTKPVEETPEEYAKKVMANDIDGA